MAPTETTIHECLGSLVFGYEDEELADAVIRLLAERGQTLATVEWGTTGLVAHWLGGVPRGGEVFRAGLVVRDCAVLEGLLKLPSGMIERNGEGSSELAAAMALAAREQTRADFALAIGKFPNFDPAAPEPPLYHFALAWNNGVVMRSSSFAAHPAILKPRAAKQALNLLRLHLLQSMGT